MRQLKSLARKSNKAKAKIDAIGKSGSSENANSLAFISSSKRIFQSHSPLASDFCWECRPKVSESRWRCASCAAPKLAWAFCSRAARVRHRRQCLRHPHRLPSWLESPEKSQKEKKIERQNFVRPNLVRRHHKSVHHIFAITLLLRSSTYRPLLSACELLEMLLSASPHPRTSLSRHHSIAAHCQRPETLTAGRHPNSCSSFAARAPGEAQGDTQQRGKIERHEGFANKTFRGARE